MIRDAITWAAGCAFAIGLIMVVFDLWRLKDRRRAMRISTMIKAIEKRRDAVGKERDKLDDMILELECLRECCARAYDDLGHARDALSELAWRPPKSAPSSMRSPSQQPS
jgi:hypothetical protein